MFLKYINLLFIIAIFSINLTSQDRVVVDVNFDGCTIEDKGENNLTIVQVGNAGCECGVSGNSLEFNGTDDGISLNGNINSLFDKDFTMEFYFSVLNKRDIVDILSLKSDCNSDSSFSLTYLPSIHEIRFLARESEFLNVELSIPLDELKCWHHIALVRKGFLYFIYLDGKISEVKNAGKKFTFAKDNIFSISNNSCLYSTNSNFNRFKGRIDEFKVYNYAINELELLKKEIPADLILNQDTTIFLGDGIDIVMGPTCAETFTWSNKIDLSDPDILTPTITPTVSTVYYINFLIKGRTCKDSIFIHIQDKDDLNCKNLLLPNSFTPNGDGVNDIYGISNKFIIEDLVFFEIYNRLGERVFRTEDKNSGWDGFYDNSKINPGKFVYKIGYTCKEKEYLSQGIINLLR